MKKRVFCIWNFCKLAPTVFSASWHCDPPRVSSVPCLCSRPGHVSEKVQPVQEQELLWSCWGFIWEAGFPAADLAVGSSVWPGGAGFLTLPPHVMVGSTPVSWPWVT